jgi:putative heme iron utilization protein
MADRPSVLRETDDNALKLARSVLRESRSAALAVLEPDSGGFPFVSRILLGIDTDGVPVMLASRLSIHTRALLADPRCSLLAGRSGKGDPLAHPRLTVSCEAQPVAPGEADHQRLRTRFLRRHPKAALYIDFPDFLFFRLFPLRACLNGGFGRAYALTGQDLLIISTARADIETREASLIEELDSLPTAFADMVPAELRGDGAWRAVGIDAAGVDLASGDRLVRHEFGDVVGNGADLQRMFVKLYR